MTKLKIKKIEIQGFRSFGKSLQSLDLNSLIACLWGPNSQGKTSLGEALEFLLTGQLVRRELLASAQDEFADAVRNVHMPKTLPVFVQVTFLGGGKNYVVKRTLDTDYGKKQNCQSTLYINGKIAAEEELIAIGVVLSQPPLRAPVLAQHTLSYLFSARPQDRASYFKALLEVTDLETLRSSVAGLDAFLKPAENPLLSKLARAIAIPAVSTILQPLTAKVPTVSTLSDAIAAALAALITAEDGSPPTTLSERIATVETLLADKRTLAFPIKAFDKTPFRPSPPTLNSYFTALSTYLTECQKADEETRRLAALFVEALKLPNVAEATDRPLDCPLCATEASLTPARIAVIRERVKDTEVFRAAEKAATAAIAQIHATVAALSKQLLDALPRFSSFIVSVEARRGRGFRTQRILSLLGSDAAERVKAWLRALRPLIRSHYRLARATDALLATLQSHQSDLRTLTAAGNLQNQYAALLVDVSQHAQILTAYLTAETPISDALKTTIDAQSQTTGWAELIEIAKETSGLRAALVAAAAVQQAQKELGQALRQIDSGNEKVLEEKFAALSAEVEKWWNLLRPDELSFFSAVRQRPGARRTIDFKAGLSANEDERDGAVFRDVIAVFSQSQLHCLGIALFIARAVHEKTGFIILDDPILSSDEDYRAHFNSAVLEKLINSGVQVILLTQDQRTCKDITERYFHRQIDTFHINLSNAVDGTSVVNKADDLAAMLARAEVYMRGGHPDLHKLAGSGLRDAAERFCKEILVKRSRAKGTSSAALSDYDGKNLGDLVPKTEPLMTADPAHPGKLRTLGGNLNPANHDDAIPNPGTLKVALGDLKALKKAYL